jgi:hypothetical protein
MRQSLQNDRIRRLSARRTVVTAECEGPTPKSASATARAGGSGGDSGSASGRRLTVGFPVALPVTIPIAFAFPFAGAEPVPLRGRCSVSVSGFVARAIPLTPPLPFLRSIAFVRCPTTVPIAIAFAVFGVRT